MRKAGELEGTVIKWSCCTPQTRVRKYNYGTGRNELTASGPCLEERK
jgi:hypothetical protein